MKTVMVQGTASSVGKSVIAAAICRILSDEGYSVAPFKAQNMSLNSFVTPQGGEIGRAQALQAQAARIDPHTDMNPILMKPERDTRAQIVFHGSSIGSMNVSEYAAFKKRAFPETLSCLERLRKVFDFVVIEGAGSPAEINLRDQDIVNMAIATKVQSPVILAADIDRGGVFASLIGTIELLNPEERKLVKGLLINKFRGDESLLHSGIEFLEQRTGIPVIGVVPYFHDIELPEEDSPSKSGVYSESRASFSGESLKVRVARLRSMSNFTDFDPLRIEPSIDFKFISDPDECSDADLLILPGSKCVVDDLKQLQRTGFADAICNSIGRAAVLGICGGFQMLCGRILDPNRIESIHSSAPALNLIPADTVFENKKRTVQVHGTLWKGGATIRGYEIHHGSIRFHAVHVPFLNLGSELNPLAEGYADLERNIFGTSVHGLFDEPEFRSWFLNRIRKIKGFSEIKVRPLNPDREIQKLANHLRKSININKFFEILDARR